ADIREAERPAEVVDAEVDIPALVDGAQGDRARVGLGGVVAAGKGGRPLDIEPVGVRGVLPDDGADGGAGEGLVARLKAEVAEREAERAGEAGFRDGGGRGSVRRGIHPRTGGVP